MGGDIPLVLGLRVLHQIGQQFRRAVLLDAFPDQQHHIPGRARLMADVLPLDTQPPHHLTLMGAGEHRPPEIGQLTNLQRLTLGNNRLAVLPPEIIQLTNLQQLSLGNNRLTALPPEIGQLTELQELALGGNQLTVLPAQIGQLTRLRALELGNNQLTVLPRQMADLFTNGLVVLSGNPFIEPLPELIKRGPKAVALPSQP
jgi:Leucine-rich repeat (LRR) protein